MVFAFFLNVLSTQAIDWLQERGEYFLSTHTSPGDTGEKSQELLKEYEDFRVSAKVRSSVTEGSFSNFCHHILTVMLSQTFMFLWNMQAELL